MSKMRKKLDEMRRSGAFKGLCRQMHRISEQTTVKVVVIEESGQDVPIANQAGTTPVHRPMISSVTEIPEAPRYGVPPSWDFRTKRKPPAKTNASEGNLQRLYW